MTTSDKTLDKPVTLRLCVTSPGYWTAILSIASGSCSICADDEKLTAMTKRITNIEQHQLLYDINCRLKSIRTMAEGRAGRWKKSRLVTSIRAMLIDGEPLIGRHVI